MANDLISQVQSASIPVYRTTKDEIVEAFQEDYGRRWRGPLVQELHIITGMKEHNLQRRFDPTRLHTAPKSAKVKAEYRQLGEKLPPKEYKAPPGGYRIFFSGKILIAGEYCEWRTFSITITGEAADELAAQASWGTIFDAYFKEDDLAEETCEVEPSISVEAA